MKRPKEITWEANPGPQTRFMRCTATELLYGGAAGGGKSDALIVAPLRWVGFPTFNALVIRRTYDEIEETLVPRSQRIFRSIAPAAKYKADSHTWTFPSGARIRFGYLARDEQVMQYQGAEFQYIGWDELTHYSEYMFRYMMSRLRGTAGLPKRVRAGSNPGGPGQDWVQRRWGPWLGGEEWTGPRAELGETLWYRNTPKGEEWVEPETEGALSRCFIPAKLEDNPKIDPGYRETLMGLDVLSRAQLLEGNWLIRASAGLLFKRGWFKLAKEAPIGLWRMARFWDRAATEEKKGNDPDWTVGVKMAIAPDKRIWILDVVRFRETPGQVMANIETTAALDTRQCEVWLSQDPGQAGKFEFSSYVKALAGFVIKPLIETGDKVTRAKPLSAQVEAGNVTLLEAPWNRKFVEELEAFPAVGVHDDQVDAASGALAALTGGAAPAKLGKNVVIPRISPRGDR